MGHSGGPNYHFQVLCTTCLEENQPHTWILDEGGENDQVAPFVLWVLVAESTGITATEEPREDELCGQLDALKGPRSRFAQDRRGAGVSMRERSQSQNLPTLVCL